MALCVLVLWSCSDDDDKKETVYPVSIESKGYYFDDNDNEVMYEHHKFTFSYEDSKDKSRITRIYWEHEEKNGDEIRCNEKLKFDIHYSTEGKIDYYFFEDISWGDKYKVIAEYAEGNVVLRNEYEDEDIPSGVHAKIKTDKNGNPTYMSAPRAENDYTYENGLVKGCFERRNYKTYDFKYDGSNNTVFKNTSLPQWFLVLLNDSYLIKLGVGIVPTHRSLFCSVNKTVTSITEILSDDNSMDYNIKYTSTYKNYPTQASLKWKRFWNENFYLHKTSITYNVDIENK